MTPTTETEDGLLAGYGCDRDGGYLVLDDRGHAPWQRRRLPVKDARFTLQSIGGRFCTGRYDLGNGQSSPCPDAAALTPEQPEQCARCWRATGFNPAFYFALEVSPQQERRNQEPHLVYLAHFGCNTLKVGITHERRGIQRMLEQGARAGAVIARFENAHRARALEEAIARQLGVPEAIRPARKRHLLGAPFSREQARGELEQLVERVRDLDPELAQSPEVHDFDPYYGGSALFERTLTDLSETEPLAISGICLGMIGDVLVMGQGNSRYMLSVGALVSRRVRLTRELQPNRVMGQLGLPF
jgi:uncharacterized protein DUF2797